jgi:hypothetical protein
LLQLALFRSVLAWGTATTWFNFIIVQCQAAAIPEKSAACTLLFPSARSGPLLVALAVRIGIAGAGGWR